MKPKHDRLLAALIAKLPAATVHWPREDRIAWLHMMATAFDIIYGACGPIRICHDESREPGSTPPSLHHCTPAAPLAIPTPPPPPTASARRYCVDRDGFAMGDGRPIAIDDLPANAVLWDERTGIESGDVSTILWRDIGATRRALPPGVMLKPALAAT
jgi:hypothetical protein